LEASEASMQSTSVLGMSKNEEGPRKSGENESRADKPKENRHRDREGRVARYFYEE